METILWFGWSIFCAWATRWTIVALLHDRFGSLSYLFGYLGWLTLLLVGYLLTEWSGFQLYGFDRSDPWQWFGGFVMFWSPLGLPLVVGAPLVIVGDAAMLVRSKLVRAPIG